MMTHDDIKFVSMNCHGLKLIKKGRYIYLFKKEEILDISFAEHAFHK